MGRWYLAGNLEYPYCAEGLLRQVNRYLDRYGLISKDIVNADKSLYSWSDIYAFLKNNIVISRKHG